MRSLWVFLANFVILSADVNGAKLPKSVANQTPLPKACNLIVYQDSHVSNAIKKLEEKIDKLAQNLENLTALITNPTPAVPASSCKELYDNRKFITRSQVYTLQFDSQKIPVYCHMGDFGCGGGGWTLAMKTDGAKKTFHYSSPFWSNKNPYNIAGGRTGFDSQETKLPTYWATPFSKICLGMKIGNRIRFVTINKQANSLYSLIADGLYRATSLGRNTWKSLIGSQASLQTNCNKEGFNVVCICTRCSKARIGIVSNENICDTCDSRIGFGTGGVPITTIHVGMRLLFHLTTETSRSRPWATSWFSNEHLNYPEALPLPDLLKIILQDVCCIAA